MNITLPYIIEVSVCFCVFYVLYFLALRHLTFFAANRFYLLAGSVLAFVIPVLSIPVFEANYDFVVKSVQGQPFGSGPLASTSPEAVVQPLLPLSTVLVMIYALGVLVFVIRFVISIWRIFKLYSEGLPEKHNDYTVIRLDDIQPFSFGRWIFLPNANVDALIIEHERLHIQQRHWIDLMIMELATCLLWFNPIVYFYKRAIQLQHEYLADRGTLRQHDRLEDYMRAVMIQLRANSLSIPVNRFHSLSIKKRILMMTQKQTSRFRAIWYAAALPIVAILLLSFAFTSERKVNTLAKTITVVPVAITPLVVQENVPSLFPVDISKLKTLVAYGERMHPFFKEVRMHTGLDFMVAEGSEIVATADGFVMEAGFNNGHGNYIILKHGETYSTHYSHMKSFIVKQGQNVKAGETIGYVGSTGMSTGPHLHYEVYQNNKQVDPKSFMPKLGC